MPGPFEDKDHYLLVLEEDTVPPKPGLVEPVRRASGEDLTRPLAGAWSEPGDDRQALESRHRCPGILVRRLRRCYPTFRMTPFDCRSLYPG